MSSGTNSANEKNPGLSAPWGPHLGEIGVQGDKDPWKPEVSKIWGGESKPAWDRVGNNYGGSNTWGVNKNTGLFPGPAGDPGTYGLEGGQKNVWVFPEYTPFGKNWSGGEEKEELKKSFSMAELKGDNTPKEAHKSASTGSFVDERSQPDGAEMLQQSKDEMIAKMVNSHDGWGKKPIRQDTPWDHPVENPAIDANSLMPSGSTLEQPKNDGVWKSPTFDIPTWSAPAEEPESMDQLFKQSPWQQGWGGDAGFDKQPFVDPATAYAAAQFWNDPTKNQLQAPQKPLSIGTWGEIPNTQTEFGVWNQPPLQTQPQMNQALQFLMENGVKKEEAINILTQNDKTSDMLGGGRGVEGRGRMLRGKSLVETPFSAFQPPQQLPQQAFKNPVNLFNQAPFHRRTTSNNFGMNNMGMKNPQIMLQMFLQLQSILQPMLLERSQVQQNKTMPLAQKKFRIDALNADIVRIKAYIDQLSADHSAPVSDERLLMQALGGLRLDQEASQDAWNSSFKHYLPPPPGLKQPPPNHFNRSTSWSLGEKKPEIQQGNMGGPARASNWLMVKDTANMEASVLHNLCKQSGTLLQLLSNRLTGHSIACYRDDASLVRGRLMQVGALSSEPLTNQDILRLLDASNGGAAWAAVTESTSPMTSTTTTASVANNNGASLE